MKTYLDKLWNCKIMKSHKWTCKAHQGIKPTDMSVEGFCEYATMYCERCGYISELSRRFTDNYKTKQG